MIFIKLISTWIKKKDKKNLRKKKIQNFIRAVIRYKIAAGINYPFIK